MAKKQMPDISEILPERKPDSAALSQKADKAITAVAKKVVNQPNLLISEELTPIMVALNKAGVNDDLIAQSIKKLMGATKSIVITKNGERVEKRISDYPIMLAATKFAAVLRDRIPSKKISGKFLNLHSNIPKPEDKNILREREEALKAAHPAEFEVMSDESIN